MEKKAERFGTLFAAGLIVGESLMGVILAFIIAASVTSGGSEDPLALGLENWDNIGELLGLAVFIFGIFIFVFSCITCEEIEIMDFKIGCPRIAYFSRSLRCQRNPLI